MWMPMVSNRKIKGVSIISRCFGLENHSFLRLGWVWKEVELLRKESLVLPGRGVVWAKAEEKSVKFTGTIQNSPLLHLLPLLSTWSLSSSPRVTPDSSLLAGSIRSPDLTDGASLISSQTHCALFPGPLQAISERDSQKCLPLPSLLSNHFPMHCQGELSKSKFEPCPPFLIMFQELQITFRGKSRALKTCRDSSGSRPSLLSQPSDCSLPSQELLGTPESPLPARFFNPQPSNLFSDALPSSSMAVHIPQ